MLKTMFTEIYGASPYNSPTDMGVNMAGCCITDDEAVKAAACDEIIRRYYSTLCARRKGLAADEEIYKIELIMKQLSLTTADRPVVAAALSKEAETALPAAALELPDGRIVTGKTSSLLGASAALLLNAVKAQGGIRDSLHLISPVIIEPIQDLKVNHLGNSNPRLHTDELLVALSICAATNPTAELAMEQLQNCGAVRPIPP